LISLTSELVMEIAVVVGGHRDQRLRHVYGRSPFCKGFVTRQASSVRAAHVYSCLERGLIATGLDG
jgi:hypothetical protein